MELLFILALLIGLMVISGIAAAIAVVLFWLLISLPWPKKKKDV